MDVVHGVVPFLAHDLPAVAEVNHDVEVLVDSLVVPLVADLGVVVVADGLFDVVAFGVADGDHLEAGPGELVTARGQAHHTNGQ